MPAHQQQLQQRTLIHSEGFPAATPASSSSAVADALTHHRPPARLGTGYSPSLWAPGTPEPRRILLPLALPLSRSQTPGPFHPRQLCLVPRQPSATRPWRAHAASLSTLSPPLVTHRCTVPSLGVSWTLSSVLNSSSKPSTRPGHEPTLHSSALQSKLSASEVHNYAPSHGRASRSQSHLQFTTRPRSTRR